MEKLKLLDLFSGIGGMSLGLERSGGFETVAFCEIEEFPRKVLKKHWPEVPQYEDVRTLTAERLAADGIAVDAICGGFPCQDISLAGAQGGIDAERSGLWSECARLLGEIRPQFALFENVTNLLNGGGGSWFKRVLWDISSVGYDVEWHCIPASAVGAPHRRDRIWIVAYPNNGRPQTKRPPTVATQAEKPVSGCRGRIDANASQQGLERHGRPGKTDSLGVQRLNASSVCGEISDANCGGPQEPRWAVEPVCPAPLCYREIHRAVNDSGWEPEPAVGRVANGVPARVDRLKGLGNAVVPQIPELIGRAWMEANHA